MIAEVTVPRDVLIQHMRVEPGKLAYHATDRQHRRHPLGRQQQRSALGQLDHRHVHRHRPGRRQRRRVVGGDHLHVELTEERDLYLSLTIPSLIVATYGGGTGLATQRECLEIMDCYGQGKVRKFAEIVAGVALAGEISLASAISSLDWVSSHEQYGRNR